MYKINEVKASLDCDLCKKLLVDPVVMPCESTICKTHLDKLMTEASIKNSTVICTICKEEHLIPKKGFIINNRLQKLLTLKLNTLKFDCQIYTGCTKEIEDANEKVDKLGLFEKNAENYIYDYFEDIKRQVDIRREDLKIKIDKYSEEIIKSVELNQKNYIKLSIEVNKITENIEKSKKDLDELISRFDTLEFNDETFKDIKASVAAVNQEFHKMLAVYQDSLIGNKEYTFDFKESPIEDIFGRVTDVRVNF